MRCALRVDAGGDVGFGHVVRCRAIAAALDHATDQVAWACRRHAAVADLLALDGALELPGPPSFSVDLDEAAAVGRWARGCEWLILDHYGPDSEYLSAIRREAQATRILLVDDHQRRAGGDLRLAPTQGPAPETLAGLDYLAMRPVFARPPAVPRGAGLVLCFGGADPLGLAARALRAGLERRAGTAPPLTAIVEDAVAARDGVDALLARWAAPTKRLASIGAERMAEELATARIALVSASGVAWESLAVGTPVVAVRWIDNQDNAAERLRDLGQAVHRDAALAMVDALAACAGPPIVVPRSVDGRGASRIVAALRASADGNTHR